MNVARLLNGARRTIGLAGLMLALALGAPAEAQPAAPAESGGEPLAEEAPPPPRRLRTDVAPYLEVAQVLSADFNGGDVLTYTSVSAGVDARVVTRRVSAQVSYRYDRRIAWEGDVADNDVHSGAAQIGVALVPNMVNLDAGALATRVGSEGRGTVLSDREAAAQIYSAYIGPSLSTHAGPVAINAAYQFGYAHVEDDDLDFSGRDRFDSSSAHIATAGIGMAPRDAPVGWTVGAGYVREDSEQLESRFEGAYVRGDVVVPVSPTLAVTAGVGYERIESSQQDIARDSNGIPIVTPDGNVIADPSRPRVLTYETDGLIYDAGLIWRPSSRTELQIRAGYRYGGETVVGSLSHRFNGDYGVSVQLFDTVSTFGRSLISDMNRLPDNFDINRNPLTGDFGGGCVFGSEPGAGVCFDELLRSITSSTFRSRGASIVFSGSRGRWDWGLGGSYVHRRYFRPTDLSALDPRTDHSFGVSANLGRQLSRDSSVDLDAFASWYDSDAPGFESQFDAGVTASYRRALLLRRLQLNAALGLYHSQSDGFEGTVASGLVGLRYTF